MSVDPAIATTAHHRCLACTRCRQHRHRCNVGRCSSSCCYGCCARRWGCSAPSGRHTPRRPTAKHHHGVIRRGDAREQRRHHGLHRLTTAHRSLAVKVQPPPQAIAGTAIISVTVAAATTAVATAALASAVIAQLIGLRRPQVAHGAAGEHQWLCRGWAALRELEATGRVHQETAIVRAQALVLMRRPCRDEGGATPIGWVQRPHLQPSALWPRQHNRHAHMPSHATPQL